MNQRKKISQMNQDKLYKFLAFNNEIRVYSVESKEVLLKYLKHVECSPIASVAIGRLMSAALMMAGMLKGDEKLLLSIDSDGPIQSLKAEADAYGTVRGFVKNPLLDVSYNEFGRLDVAKAVGHGILTVKKQLNLKEPFTGSCELVSGEIAEDISYYFGISEQTPTVVALGVNISKEGTIDNSGGFIIQMLPNASEEAYQYVEELLKKVTSVSELLNKFGPEQLVHELFNDATLVESYPVRFQCSCSRRVAINILKRLEYSDLETIINEDHKAEVTCNFCNRKYHFTEEELKQILEEKRCEA